MQNWIGPGRSTRTPHCPCLSSRHSGPVQHWPTLSFSFSSAFQGQRRHRPIFHWPTHVISTPLPISHSHVILFGLCLSASLRTSFSP